MFPHPQCPCMQHVCKVKEIKDFFIPLSIHIYQVCFHSSFTFNFIYCRCKSKGNFNYSALKEELITKIMTAWACFKNEQRHNSKVGFEHDSNRKTHNRKKQKRRKRMKSCGMTKTDRWTGMLT